MLKELETRNMFLKTHIKIPAVKATMSEMITLQKKTAVNLRTVQTLPKMRQRGGGG